MIPPGIKKPAKAGLGLLTKREKTWFFPLCGYQPKINILIFLFCLTSHLVFLLSPEVRHQSGTRKGGSGFYLLEAECFFHASSTSLICWPAGKHIMVIYH
ncbi:hypothetical protein F3J28_00225 [Enterobacter sp. Ap-1006]|nr:hypothetical protein [Enterobacter sp. Ap-1006]